LVECGPGRGTFMADMLRVFAHMPGLMDALHIHLVEISPALRKVQEKTLRDFTSRVAWHGDLGSVPEGMFALIANEFLDVLPLYQFQCEQGRWFERRVALRG